jgi:hypothetical protein
MSTWIPAKLKATLGEYLAEWYRQFGKVTPRRPYHEDDEDGGKGTASATPLFESHPLFSETPIGASSDLASIIVNDEHTLEAAEKRTDELTEALQNKLALELGQKKQHKQSYQSTIKLQPFYIYVKIIIN